MTHLVVAETRFLEEVRLFQGFRLNAAEGSGSSGGTRQQRYRTALGSARETGACLDVALAFGYLEQVDPEVLHKLDVVRATLARLVR